MTVLYNRKVPKWVRVEFTDVTGKTITATISRSEYDKEIMIAFNLMGNYIVTREDIKIITSSSR